MGIYIHTSYICIHSTYIHAYMFAWPGTSWVCNNNKNRKKYMYAQIDAVAVSGIGVVDDLEKNPLNAIHLWDSEVGGVVWFVVWFGMHTQTDKHTHGHKQPHPLTIDQPVPHKTIFCLIPDQRMVTVWVSGLLVASGRVWCRLRARLCSDPNH